MLVGVMEEFEVSCGPLLLEALLLLVVLLLLLLLLPPALVLLLLLPLEEDALGKKGEDVLKSSMACAVVRSSGLRSNKEEQTVWSRNFSC